MNGRKPYREIASLEEVHDFYERLPYPAPLTTLEGHRELYQDFDRRRSQFHLLWPTDPLRVNLEILVAGCGTSQAARYALRERDARVTAIDISETSLVHTRALQRTYELNNLELHQLSIESVRKLGRTFDLIVAALAITLLFPVWLIIALLIKLDSKGPVFYTQERVGMDGRLFLLYKFRTMKADADSELHREYQRAFIAGRAEANLGNETKPTYKLLADPRITRIGKALRRISLDEVPQLLNVLSGDMSLVGPRPPIPYEVEAYELWHRKRLDMKPGLTGLWQVSGRNRLPFEEMVRLDLFYIENWSLLLDLKIILRTGFVMLGGEGH